MFKVKKYTSKISAGNAAVLLTGRLVTAVIFLISFIILFTDKHDASVIIIILLMVWTMMILPTFLWVFGVSSNELKIKRLKKKIGKGDRVLERYLRMMYTPRDSSEFVKYSVEEVRVSQYRKMLECDLAKLSKAEHKNINENSGRFRLRNALFWFWEKVGFIECKPQ